MNEVQARLKGARLSAQKARLVADQIRGKHVEEALNTRLVSRRRKQHILLRKFLRVQLRMQSTTKVLMLMI